jgi:hypothetical protein
MITRHQSFPSPNKLMKKFPAVLAALFSAALCASAAVLPAEKMLPGDTLVLLSIPDFTKMREIYRNSPQGRFWSDPAMKPFADKFTAKLESELISPLEHEMGIHLSDYTNVLQGQCTLALVQNGWTGKEKDPNDPAFLVLLDSKDKSPWLKSNLTDLKKKWVDAGKSVRTEKIRDVEFSAIILSTNDIPKSLKKKPPVSAPDAPEPMEDPDAKNAPKKPLYIGQADSLLIMGSSPRAIEKVLAAMSGGSVNTLNDLAAYSSVASMAHDSPIFGWVNVKAFVDAIIRRSEAADDNAPNPLGFEPAKLMTALGFSGLKTAAFNYRYSPEGAQFNFVLSVPESERVGLFKILAGVAKDYNPPPFVAADAAKFQRWRLDGRKLWDTIHKIAADTSPGSVGGIDFMIGSAEKAAQEKDPTFDIQKNLFGNLGDDLITYQKNPKSASFEDISSPPSIYLIGSPNPEQLGNAIKSLLVLYQQPTTREFLGHKIYSVPVPSAPGPKGEPRPAHSIGYTFNNGYVAISGDPAMLEEFLRSGSGDTKSLRDLPGMADATQKVGGGGTSLFGYENDSENMRFFLEALKKDTATDPLASLSALAMVGGMNSSQTKLKDWIDISLLPAFDQVSKYFYFSVYSGQAAPDGLYFKAFAPMPPGLKK